MLVGHLTSHPTAAEAATRGCGMRVFRHTPWRTIPAKRGEGEACGDISGWVRGTYEAGAIIGSWSAMGSESGGLELKKAEAQ
jgi:hypothetical protein